jgi:hypothetical protein
MSSTGYHQTLVVARVRLIEYLNQVVIPREDWHGVADCAMDLREIDAELRGMERTLSQS